MSSADDLPTLRSLSGTVSNIEHDLLKLAIYDPKKYQKHAISLSRQVDLQLWLLPEQQLGHYCLRTF